MNSINKIFVINLDKDNHRFEKCKYQFQQFNITNYERFKGIHGKELSKTEISNLTTSIGKYIVSKNMVGCGISHIKLWEKIVNENIEKALILEDDFIFKDDFLNKFNKIIENTPIDYDMIFLTSNFIHNKTLKLYDINEYFYKQSLISQTLGYIITLNGAKKILKDINKVTYHIDVELCLNSLLYNYNIISVKDELIYQTFEESNNTNDRYYPLLLNTLITDNNVNYIYKTILISFFDFEINFNVIIIFLMGYYIFQYANVLLIIEYMYKPNNTILGNFCILSLGFLLQLYKKMI